MVQIKKKKKNLKKEYSAYNQYIYNSLENMKGKKEPIFK